MGAMKDDETRLVYIALAGLIIFGGIFFRNILFGFLLNNDRPLEERLSGVTWQQATTTIDWQARDSHTVFEFQNKLWLLGGINGNTNTNGSAVEYWDMPHFNDIWSSADGLVWKRESAAAAWPPRRSASVGQVGDSLYLMGGWSPVSGYMNDIWKSADGITWQDTGAEAAWPRREGQILVPFQNTLFIFGGVNYDTRTVFNDVWYSTDGTNWEEATTTIPWSGRWDHAVVEFNNELYLIGGMNLEGDEFNDVWKSADGLNWELVTHTPPWEARQGFAALTYNNALWLVGRLNDSEHSGANDIWFTTNGTDWIKTTENPAWLGREDHAGIVFQNKMFVMGGMDKNWRWQNDVWFSELPSQ
jgi:hypothetical protein